MNNLHIIFAPLLPMHLLMALAALAGAISLFAVIRRARGSILRASAFALILAALTNPSLLKEEREPLKDTALIVVDDSASMKIGDRAAQAAKAAADITKKLSTFPDLDVETIHVAGNTETDLFQALEPKLSTLPHDRLAGIIAITDGEVHDHPARALRAPFHALIAGHQNEIDRRIIIKQAPAYGIVGKKISLTLRVEDSPEKQSDRAAVTLHRDDGTSETIALPVGQDIPFDTSIDHAGKNLFAFDVEPLPNELTTINNSTAVSVNGIRDRLRVLLVSGEPHIGGRTWRNFLKNDPAVDLVHFTILRSLEKASFTPSHELALINFPVDELFKVKLKSFDLVILDRISNHAVIPDEYLENIAHYVDNGGALLVSLATDDPQATTLGDTPLAKLLPAAPTEILTGQFTPALTDAGKRHPVTAALPEITPHGAWAPWFRQVATHGAKGDTLMSGLNGQPLLVLDHVGQGRVAEFLSDQFWLWARGYEGGGPQAELLRRVAHWLVQEPELDEMALSAHADYTNGGWQLTIIKQSLHDDTATVTLTDPEGKSAPITLGKLPETGQPLGATVPVATTGIYHIKDGDKEILVMVGPADVPEFGALRATEQPLAPIVKATDGGAFWLDDHPSGPEIKRTATSDAQSGWGWIGLRHNDQFRVVGSKSYPLWPVWAAVAVLLITLMLVWRREGK